MINRTELRIGNIIQFANTIQVVDAIDQEGFLNCVVLHSDRHVKEFESVPLTEEWLLRFGFEITDQPTPYNQRFFWELGPIGIAQELIEKPTLELIKGAFRFWYSDDYSLEVKYVHQLQNLYFALTGTELTIKELVK